MTPTPSGSGSGGTQPPGSWYDYAQRLPADLPDVAYDAQRDQYFNSVVKPWVYKNGMSLEKVREEFMAATPRPGKSEYPRLELGAKSAARALLDPIAGAAGFPEVQQFLKKTEADSALEAQKQGINPTPYQMIGSMAGQAPYWYAGMEAAGLAAGAVAPVEAGLGGEALAAATANLEKTRKLFNVAAGMAVQGGYDAARAEDGHRTLEGVKGALEGGAFVGAFEGAGPLWKLLRSKGLSEASAKAVEAAAKGVADEGQIAQAGAVVEQSPEVVQMVAEAAREGVKAGKRQGRPAKPPVAEPTAPNVQVVIDTNESRIAQLQQSILDLKKEQLPEAAATLSEALQQGVTIDSLNGDPENLGTLLREVDSHSVASGLFDTRLELNGEATPAGGPAVVMPFETPAPAGEAITPSEPSAITPEISSSAPIDMEWLNDHMAAFKIPEEAKPEIRQAYVEQQSIKGELGTLSDRVDINRLSEWPKAERAQYDRIAAKLGIAKDRYSFLFNQHAVDPEQLEYTSLGGEVQRFNKTPQGYQPEPDIEVLPANPLIASLRSVLLNPKLNEAQKAASRLRLQRLSPDALQEIDALVPTSSGAREATATEGGVQASPPPLVQLAAPAGAEAELAPGELARMQALSREKAATEGFGQPTGARLGLQDISEFDQLEQLRSGKVRDKITGRIYSGADEALRAKGLSAPDRFAAYSSPDRFAGLAKGYWVNPEGKAEWISEHEEWAAEEAKRRRWSLGKEENYSDLLRSRNYVRLQGYYIEAERSAIGKPSFDSAVYNAIDQAKTIGSDHVVVDIYDQGRVSEAGNVKLADIGEFLHNPIKYLKVGQMKFAANPSGGYWVRPDGEYEGVDSHEEWANNEQRRFRYKGSEPENWLINKKGYAKTQGWEVVASTENISKPSLDSAVVLAAEDAKRFGRGRISLSLLSKEGEVNRWQIPLEEIGEFLQHPAKFLRTTLNAPNRFAASEKGSINWSGGTYTSPSGSSYNVRDHWDWAAGRQEKAGVKTTEDEWGRVSPDPEDWLQNQGWVKTHGNEVIGVPVSIGKLSLDVATYEAQRAAKQAGVSFIYVNLDSKKPSVRVPLGDIGEFLSDPSKYLHNQMRFAVPEEGPINPLRRSFLKQVGGAAASAGLSGATPEALQGLAKASEAGNKVAQDQLKSLLDHVITHASGGEFEMRDLKGYLVELISSDNPKLKFLRTIGSVMEGSAAQHLELGSFYADSLASMVSHFGSLGAAEKAVVVKEVNSLSVRELVDVVLTERDFDLSGIPKLEKFAEALHASDLSWEEIHGVLQKIGVDNDKLSHFDSEDLANFEEGVKTRHIEVTQAHERDQQSFAEEIKSRKEVEAQRLQTQRSGTITPGMELARTPLGLGEEGKGGVLTRYAEGQDWDSMSAEEQLAAYKQSHGVSEVVERPTQTRITGSLAEGMLPQGTVAGTFAPPGQKPTIYYRNPNPTNMFHESLHGAVGFFDLAAELDQLVRSHPTGGLMEAAFDPKLKELYGTTWPEEAYVYAASAIRTNNSRVLQPFIDADSSRAEVLRWVADNTDTLLGRIAERADSPYRSVAERRLREVLRRSTGEIDLIARDTTKVVGDELGMQGGDYVVTNRAGVSSVFDNRDGLVNHLEEHYEQPLSAPQLVDESLLPEGLPRPQVEFDAHSLGRAPIYTGPPEPLEPTAFAAEEPPIQGPRTETGRVRGGVQALSAYIRPGYAWLDSVARKNDWPELYDKFKAIDNAQVELNNFTRPYRVLLNDIFSGVKQSRQSDLYRWLEASTEDKDKVAEALHINDAEVGKLNRLREEFFNPLFEQFGIHPNTWIDNYAPRLRDAKLDPDAVKPTGKMTPEEVDFFAKHVRTGELDPYDTNLSRVAQAYLRLGAREKFLGEPLKQAAELVNLKTPNGEFATGTLHPILQRWVESVRGIPDYTGKVIDGAMQVATESMNDVIDGLNKKLPENLQIEQITSAPRDIIGKWILMTYAGQLGLRPMVPVRDFLTTFITGYPILGGKYLAIGAKKAFEQGAYETAQEAGALLEPNFMRALYNTGEQGVGNTLSKVAEATLKPAQWSNNVSRLVSFWGHNERALDAMEAFSEAGGEDVKKLVRDSALTFVDESLQKSFIKEISGAKPNEFEGIAKRIAKELTEVEHWNYRTGANPGIYKYTLGRLFGQYGTWPLNYIEYARRIVANGDKVETFKAFTRLVIAHGAILSAAQHMGIDSAQWVFTQPAAYGGGPLMQAVINIPGTVDFESYKGAEARHNVIHPFFPTMIPGGVAMQRFHKALTSNDPDLYKILLGFVPMKSTEQDKFWHQLVP
jgi:hypothetical protein